MAFMISDWIHTSNDLLFTLMEKHATSPAGYHVIAQSMEEVRSMENAPACNMEPYLRGSAQINRLKTISIYTMPGESFERARVLYMNAAAIRVWREMGKSPTIIGTQTRPPLGAILTVGVPFLDKVHKS